LVTARSAPLARRADIIRLPVNKSKANVAEHTVYVTLRCRRIIDESQ
jgi:hypothetical protein